MMVLFGDEALLRAALDFEAALARAAGAEGEIPVVAAEVIIEVCRNAAFDISELADEAAHAGTLAIPLVAELRIRIAKTDPQAAKSLHKGGTSQDLADTALMLQAKAGLALIVRDADALRQALADLAGAVDE